MKVDVKVPLKVEPDIEYPVLMESADGSLVLFSAPRCGVRLRRGITHRNEPLKFDQEDDWINASSSHWHRFEGNVTLSND